MITDESPAEHPERRAADAIPRQFSGDVLNRIEHSHPAFADAQIEMIDMDVALPPGHGHGHESDEHFQPAAAAGTTLPLDKEQNRARLQLSRFKGTLDEFEILQVTRVDIASIKRGDVIQIKTFAGSIYISVIDRIQGISAGIGEILCECRYDLPNQWTLVHAASIILPVCTKDHLITNPDGSQRKASRALKITTAAELPDQVKSLLRENFFSEIRIYATPQKERLRPVDIVRGIKRLALKLKAGQEKS
ncbi:MAG: hypothetical protein WC023_11205 [Rhodocyclaceae bacterium]